MRLGRSLRFIFKNRGALLVPVALALVVFGRPTIASATAGLALAALGEIIRLWAVGYSGVTTRAEVVTAPALVTPSPQVMVAVKSVAGAPLLASVKLAAESTLLLLAPSVPPAASRARFHTSGEPMPLARS